MKTSNKQTKLNLIIFILSVSFSFYSHAQIIDSIAMKGPVIKTFRSKILGEDRKIFIQTPTNMRSYDSYPVLYVLDGESQFIMTGGQVQYLSEAYKVIPSMIVVGIANTDRTRDLTPTHSVTGPDGKPDTSANAFGRTSGGAEKFLQFIKDELMPFIESNYPVAPYKILCGHSLGGLLAVYCMTNHPSLFNAYIGISPSLQWDNEIMIKEVVAKLNGNNLKNTLLFFSDANEDAAFHQNQLKLDSILKKKNIAGLKYKRSFYPEESHISEPVKGFYEGIRFIYPAWHLPYNSSAFKKTMRSNMIINHYKQLSQLYGYTVIPPHDDIIAISRFLRNDPNRILDAIELLQMNAVNFPASPVVHETLGDTYLKAGDAKNARLSFQKVLQADPSNKKIEQKLNTIQ